MRTHFPEQRLVIKPTVLCIRNPLLRPLEGLFISNLLGGSGLNRDKRGVFEGRGLFHLERTRVSVLHKELEYKAEKVRYKKVGCHGAKDQNQIQTSSWQINHSGSDHTI